MLGSTVKSAVFNILQTCRVVPWAGLLSRKPVNANTGLKVNRGNNFSCMKVLSTVYVLCSLGLLMLKTDGQKI